VDLFSINDKRLVTEGKITVNFVVADETPHQLLEQEFIIVDGIFTSTISCTMEGNKLSIESRKLITFRKKRLLL
jgi:hypothetical protein